MGQLIRSARGELIDFELLAIKQQLASAPKPKLVEQRQRAIDLKDGVKTAVTADVDFTAIEEAGATPTGQAKQIQRK